MTSWDVLRNIQYFENGVITRKLLVEAHGLLENTFLRGNNDDGDEKKETGWMDISLPQIPTDGRPYTLFLQPIGSSFRVTWNGSYDLPKIWMAGDLLDTLRLEITIQVLYAPEVAT